MNIPSFAQPAAPDQPPSPAQSQAQPQFPAFEQAPPQYVQPGGHAHQAQVQGQGATVSVRPAARNVQAAGAQPMMGGQKVPAPAGTKWRNVDPGGPEELQTLALPVQGGSLILVQYAGQIALTYAPINAQKI